METTARTSAQEAPVETVAQTQSITGQSYVPNCVYCAQPLTSNEFDSEPGGTPGFYSAHWACVHPSEAGRYAVVCVSGPESWVDRDLAPVPASRRYVQRKRAEAEAASLTQANAQLSSGPATFRVRDLLA